MKTNLAYIDNTIESETNRRHANADALTDGDRVATKRAALKTVAGFEIHDGAAERQAIDALIASRREAIETFRADRILAREKLGALGIVPLAVLPLGAWNEICELAGLFRLSPDKMGRVGVAPNAFNDFIIETATTKMGMLRTPYVSKSVATRETGPDEIDAQARKDWPAFLLRMFPGRVSPVAMNNASWYGETLATLVLPAPPADVAAILLKASAKEYLGLKVAAVAEAIGFKETPAELLREETARREAEARHQEMTDPDPIIYYEHGSAAAIIAQFGEFPIEKQVVDAVMSSDRLVGETAKNDAVDPIAYQSVERAYIEFASNQVGSIRPPWASPLSPVRFLGQ